MTNLVHPDPRGRISLAKYGVKPYQTFIVKVTKNGTIYLTPAKVVPEVQSLGPESVNALREVLETEMIIVKEDE